MTVDARMVAVMVATCVVYTLVVGAIILFILRRLRTNPFGSPTTEMPSWGAAAPVEDDPPLRRGLHLNYGAVVVVVAVVAGLSVALILALSERTPPPAVPGS